MKFIKFAYSKDQDNEDKQENLKNRDGRNSSNKNNEQESFEEDLDWYSVRFVKLKSENELYVRYDLMKFLF